MHLAEDLKDIHGELAALDRLGPAERDQVLDKHVLFLELRIDLGEHIALALEQDEGLLLEVERAFDSSLEGIEILGREVCLGTNVQEVLFEQDAAEGRDLCGGCEAGDQSLGQVRRVRRELGLNVGFGALSDGVVSAEQLLKCGFHSV